jgi:type II secretory pathway pseudopilin PulG
MAAQASRVGGVERAPPRYARACRPWWGWLRSTHPTDAGRDAFTLLEILLALMLTSLLLVALSMAIDFHLRVAEKSRVEVEEGQLARVLLHRIADDLRSAVAPAAKEDQAAASSGAEEESSDSSTSLDDTTTSDPTESAIASDTPGLYGEIDWLQVDVLRLPRLDQYYQAEEYYETGQSSELTVPDVLSAVKTVTYYLLAPGQGNMVTSDEGTEEQTGLVRREMDRAVTAWADEQGQLDQTLLETAPIAPEVVAIEFLYFDGTEWVESWDSEELGGLPVAVQISLAFAPADEESDDQLDAWATTDFQQLAEEGTTPIYRLMVHLPNGKALSTTEGGTEALDGSETGGM